MQLSIDFGVQTFNINHRTPLFCRHSSTESVEYPISSREKKNLHEKIAYNTYYYYYYYSISRRRRKNLNKKQLITQFHSNLLFWFKSAEKTLKDITGIAILGKL